MTDALNIAGIVGVRAAGASVRMAGVQGAGMSIALCTHPARCEGMETAHSVMAGQLADALAQVSRTKAQLAAAQAEVERLTTELATAKRGVEFYMGLLSEQHKRKAVTA